MVKQRWDVPWMTTPIRRLIRKKKRIYNAYKRNPNDNSWEKFTKTRKTVQKELNRSKNDYLLGLLEDPTNPNSDPSVSKRFWGHVKSLKRDSTGISTLQVDGKEMVSAKDKAYALSQQYSSVFTTEDLSQIPCLVGKSLPTIEPLVIDPEGVEKLLCNINPKKANGPDGVPSTILKYLGKELAPIVAHIFQQSLDTGDVPADWLTANISAIFKKGDKSIPANYYRPVSLTSVSCKLFEHILFRHIMSHLENFNVLSSFQHGFRAQHSCESQLIITVEDLAKNLDNKIQTDVLILDFQKAFDTVPHQRLIQKLEFYGIRGNILKWITKWLTSTTQQVVVDGECSASSPVKSGVPQGTVLGPLMFLLYINDITDNLDSNTKIRLFADDCLLYRSITTEQDSRVLQKDLNSLVEWSSKWQMSFNTRKCKTLRVTTKRNPIEFVTMNTDELENVSHHPYLGVELGNNLKWSNHINNVTLKANNALWFIRRNLWRCTKYVKQQMYFALVRPHLEFACAVWDPFTACDIQRLEAVQRREARFVTNNHKRTEGTVTNIMKDLQWPSLEQRRKTNRLAIMYKIQNDQIAIPIPHYLHRQTAQTRQFHPQRFRTVAIHSDTYKHSFFPRTIKDWNSLTPSMYDAKSLVVFKQCIQNV